MSPAVSFTSFDTFTPTVPAVPATLPPDLVRRLREDAAGYWPLAYQWLQDSPMFGLGGGSGIALGGASGTINDRRGGRDLPLFWSEPDLRGFRVLSRFLCDTNPFAIGFLSTLVNYHIRKGFSWQACKQGTRKTPYPVDDRTADPLVKKAQHILDSWRDANLWTVRSREAFRRFRRDGEVFGRLFWDRETGWGKLSVWRFIEPEQVGDPSGATDGPRSFGILTHPLDVDNRLGIFVRDPEGTGLAGEWVTSRPDLDVRWVRSLCDIDDYWEVVPGTTFHIKANVDSTIKRGLPDFFPVKDTLDGVRKLLRNTLLTACDQASVAWIEKFATATGPQVSSLIPLQTTTPGTTVPIGGDPNPWPWPWFPGLVANRGGSKYQPGTILRVEGNREYMPTPASGQVPNYIAVEQAALRGCCVRWNMPELTGSSDTGNSPYASALAADMPFRVAVEGSQAEWGELWERPIALGVLDRAMDAGLLTPEERAQLDVEVTEPSLISAKASEETTRRRTLNEAKVLSVQTWQLQENLDPQHEAENFKAFDEAQQAAQQQTQSPPPASPPPPPSGGGGPYPAGGGYGGIFAGEESYALLKRAVREAIAGQPFYTLWGSQQSGAGRREDCFLPPANPWESWVLESGFTGIITDKLGHKRRYQDGKEVALQDDSTSQNDPGKNGQNIDQKATPEEVAQGLEAKIDRVEPGLSKKPGLLGRAKKAVYAAYEHVNYLLVKYQSKVDAIGELLGAVLDTPKDMEKFGYNPSISSGGHASSVLDPLQVHAGISTHFACTLATHAITFGFKAAKKLLAGKKEGDESAGAIELAAILLHGVFEAINRELGLEGVPEASAIAAKLREMVGGK